MKWEYLTVVVNDVQQLNALGAEGWELVTAITQATNTVWCVFKRPIDESGGKTRKRA